jgi:uncharacterized sulfatase
MRLFPAFLALLAFAPLHAADERPKFLWIIAEDISPNFGCYGDRDANTPHLDALAERSHLFTRAFATAPMCSPSRSAMAGGVYPTSLGTQHMFSDIRPSCREWSVSTVQTLHFALIKSGLETAESLDR